MEQVKTILAELGFTCQEKDLSLAEVRPLPKELYVREKVDPQWVENLKEYILEGALQPFIVCAHVEGLKGLHLIDTHHTYFALKSAGRTSAKALVVNEEIPIEKIIIVQLRLNRSEQKPLTLKEKRHSVLKHYLNIKNKLGKDFYRKRGQIIKEIMEETGFSRPYIYKILEETLQKEKEELKQLVKELYNQGKSQYEIEEILGVPQQTVSYWLNENNYQIITNPSTAVDDFSLKTIFTEEGGLDREFLELLSGKLEEGMRVQEFLAEYGKAFKAEDVKRFREWIGVVVEEAMLESHGKKDFFVYLIKEKLPLSERAIKNLYEHAKALVGVIDKARQEFRSLVEELCLHDEAVSEEAIYRLIKERLHEKRTKGRFGEGNEYAIVSNFILKHFSKFASLEEEKIRECVESMPVLNAEDVELDEGLLELTREEFETEIRARFPNYKVPQAVLQKLWEKLRQEKEKRERERELAILEELLQRAKDPYVQSVDSLPKSPEEAKVLKKYYHEVLQAFNSVKTAKLEDLKDFQGETLEELRNWLVSNGFRVHNAEKLLAQLKEKKRAMELLEEFRRFPYASIEEFREKLSDQDRLVFAKYSTLFFEEFAKWPKAGDEEHMELARRMLDEGLSEDQLRLEYWRETGKIISPATLREYVQRLRAEREIRLQEEMLLQVLSEIEKEEEEKKKGITLKGVLSIAERLHERMQKLKAHLKDVEEKEVKTLIEKMDKDIQELKERVQYTLSARKGLRFPARKLAVILLRLNEFSLKYLGARLIHSKDDMKRYMKLLDETLERYLVESGYDFEKDFSYILRAFLETYAYVSLRFYVSNEVFFRNFLKYRLDIGKGLTHFKDSRGNPHSMAEITNWVENYLKEVGYEKNSG